MPILKVEKYCEGCPVFEADVIRPPVLHGMYPDVYPDVFQDTEIRCAHREFCDRAYRKAMDAVRKEDK